MSRSRRPERLSGLLLQEISRTVLHVIKDPRIQGVTFTEVNVSSDLRHARVYYSILGEGESQEEAAKGLQSAKGLIKREVGRHLSLRYMPEIEFIFDDSLLQAEHIEKLLTGIHRTEP